MLEIYDERELMSDLTLESDAEALELIRELGLQTEDGARINYPTATEDQAFIIDMLFPTSTRIQDYRAGCIPLRVLQLIKAYRLEHPDHRLIIRHGAPAQMKDPILLACFGSSSWMDMEAGSYWDTRRLLARWGDSLDPWDQMLVRAEAVMARKVDALIAQVNSLKGQTLRRVPTIMGMPS